MSSPNITDPIIEEQLRAFTDLFPGNERFHGESAVTSREGPKVQVDAETVQGPLTPELYRRHLEDPDFYLGICPRFENDDCQVGAIDLDKFKELANGKTTGFKPEQLTRVLHLLAGLSWTLIPERSKSGGLHLWWFLPRPMPANEVREVLQAALIHLCLPSNTEVFPRKKSSGNGGSWIHLPKPSSFLSPDGSPMSFEQALLAVQWSVNNYRVPTVNDDDDKPEIEDLIQESVDRIGQFGGRNDAGFFLACRLRDSLYSRDEAREVIEPWLAAALAVIPNSGGEPYTVKEVRASFNSAYNQEPRPRTPKTEWPMARPLSRLPQTIPLTAEIMPEILRACVFDIAERQGSSPDGVFAAHVVTLSGAVSSGVDVQPKNLDPSWRLPVNMYGMLVANPSERKSAVINAATEPLARAQAVLSKKYLEELQVWEEERRQLKKGEPLPDKPTQTKVLVQDSTPEKTAMLLQDNPRGLTFVFDEIAFLFDEMRRPERKAARTLFKSCWSREKFSQDRVGRPPIFLEAPTLSVFGGVQPKVLRDSAKDLAEDGLIFRFQATVFIESKLRTEVNRPPDADAARRLEQIFDRFLAIPVARRVMKFTPEAQELYMRWCEDLGTRIYKDPSDWMKQLLGKYNSFVPRLAALYELCGWADDKKCAGHISLRSLITAIKAAAYFESHARRIYGETGAAAPEAQVLADKIRSGQVDSPFTAREVRRKGFKGLNDVAQVDKAIATLASLRWIRAKKRSAEERGDRWEINPDVLEEGFQQYGESEAVTWDLSWLDDWKPTAQGPDLPLITWEKAFKPQPIELNDFEKLMMAPEAVQQISLLNQEENN